MAPKMPTTPAPETPTAAQKLAAMRPAPIPTAPVRRTLSLPSAPSAEIPPFTDSAEVNAWVRAVITGPSFAGKTLTSLLMAMGILRAMGKSETGTIALIDTEHRLALYYKKRFRFQHCDLADTRVSQYIGAIKNAAAVPFDVLIIDSISHAWYAILDAVEQTTNRSTSKNGFAAWGETGTPMQREFIDAILSYPGHIVATMRSKIQWEIETNERGKKVPVKIGLAPVQRVDVGYEFPIQITMNAEHVGKVESKIGKFESVEINEPGEDLGAALVEFLNESAE